MKNNKKYFLVMLALSIIILLAIGASKANANIWESYKGTITFDNENPIHKKAIHLSIPEGKDGANLPVYCLDPNVLATAGTKTVANLVVNETDGSAWFYSKSGATKIKNGETINSLNKYQTAFSITQILQMQYIVGVDIGDGSTYGKDLNRDSWTLSKQVAIWIVSKNGQKFWDSSNRFTTDEANINFFATRFGLNENEINDVKNNTKKLYDDSLKYAESMQNYSSMQKAPSISVVNKANIYSESETTYKIGPFKLDYNKNSLKTIEGIKVEGDAGEVLLDSNYYEYADGTRGTTLPKSGESFYIHIQDSSSTNKITKVSIKYKYESYEKINLYAAGMGETTQPVLLVEGIANKGILTASVDVDIPIVRGAKWSLVLYKTDMENKEETTKGIAGATFRVKYKSKNGETTKNYTTIKNAEQAEYNDYVIWGNIEPGETQTLEVTEIAAPSGYVKLNGTVTVTIKCDDNLNVTMSAACSDLTYSYDNTDDGEYRFNIREDNRGYLKFFDRREGKYNIQIVKVDEDTGKRLSGAKFTLNGTEMSATNSNGISTSSNIAIKGTGTDTLTIIETEQPDDYQALGTIKLKVSKGLVDNKYVATGVQITQNPNNCTAELSGNTIILKVPNKRSIKNGEYYVKIVKQDIRNEAKLSGARFSLNGTAISGATNANGVLMSEKIIVNSEGTDKITISEIEAPEDYQAIGDIKLAVTKKIVDYTYKATEVKITQNPNNCTAELSGNTIILKVPNEPIIKEGEYYVKIVKQDNINGAKLSGARFSLNGTEISGATNANGVLISEKIIVNSEGTDQITISEIEAPANYEAIGNIKLNVTKKVVDYTYTATSVTITQSQNGSEAKLEGDTIVLTIPNKRKTIKLSGYVWEDEKQGKEATLNGKKDSNEKLLKDVKVYLHVDGKAVYSESLWETKTNSNGHYEFEVPMGASYYVEFKYNGYNYQHTKYTKYTGTASPITSNATETESTRDSFNNRLAEIGPNTTISNVKVSNKDNELSATELGTNDIYAISAYVGGYGEQNTTKFSETAENINLGITKRENVDLAVRKDVYNTTISIKGKTQTYTYNRNNQEKDSNGNSYWDISVRRSDSQYYSNYTREIKEADYNYDGTDRLEVQVTYKIVVRNQSGVVNTKVTELVEYYDNDYTLEKVETDAGEINVSNTSKYSHNTTIASYQKKYLQIDKELTPEQDLTLYATFSVKTDNSGKIKLDSDSGKGNMVEIMGYSTYYGSQAKSPNYGNTEDTYTEYKEGEVVGRIDVDSNPGNAASMDEKEFEDDTDRAPYISFKLDENKRTTSGIVWEDARTNEVAKAMVGNGIREEGESGVSGVKVQLIDLDTGAIAKIWNNGWQNAETTTGEDGKYTIAGFVPGNYYIQFIYPDGQNYKSTTFNYTEVCKDFNVDNPDNLGTYCETTTNYSDARDIYGSTTMAQSRLYVNSLLDDQTSATLADYESKDKSMKAVTGKFEVTIEKGGNNIQGLSGSEVREYKMENIDFGLQERPKAQLMLTKEVKNVKVVLANGNTLFDASGQATNVLWIRKTGHNYGYENYMMKVPSVRENAQRIQLTMDEELMHGATIKITYGIVVQNIGEVDYASKKFYYSGVRAGSEAPIKTTIKQIIDYPGAVGGDGSADNNSTRGNLQYTTEGNTGWEVVTTNNGLVKITSDGEDVTENVLRNYKTILTYTYNSNNELLPAIYNADEVGSKTEEVTLTLSQVMTTESGSDELAYKNIAEIVKVSNGAARTMEYSTPGNQNPDEEIAEVDADVAQSVTILPPFGQTYIYYILGGVVAIIAIGGITLIKIKVLKNKK